MLPNGWIRVNREPVIGKRAKELDKLPVVEKAKVGRKGLISVAFALLIYVVLLALLTQLVINETGFPGTLLPSVFLLAFFFFETVDSSAGMGLGTALTPLLLQWATSLWRLSRCC